MPEGHHFDQYIALQLLFFFNPVKGVPADMDLTLADASEVDHLLAHLQPGRVYVKDRGHCCFRLFQAIVDSGSHFVCRARDNSVYQVIEIQVYLAIIVCLLIALWTGKKPTLRTIEMIRFYFIGWAELDELEAHLAKLPAIPV